MDNEKALESVEDVEAYLRDYHHSTSSSYDDHIELTMSDVSRLADGFRKNEVYVYTAASYMEELKEWIHDSIAEVFPGETSAVDLDHVREWIDQLEELSTVDEKALYVQELGSNTMYAVRP